MNTHKGYSLLEERINISSHVIGLLLSIVALVFLVIRATASGELVNIISFTVFGMSLIALYAASTIYHSAPVSERRNRLRIVDHAAIYVLIAGSYTPFTLITLEGLTGWLLFGIAWGMALTGIILKIFFTGRYDLISTLMYVFMGWIIIFAINPLMENLSPDGLSWLVAGGVAYTVGAILYGIDKMKFNHAIFHVFVLLGSFCHFMAVYFYVLPAE
ncbi:MAG TPA: hemolysin III family protein [Gammaproteobacteria bacterium]|nr:hemolysin III family protein [Gammaproteobacteria bacterium]